MKKIAAVIINRNTKEFLRECIVSLESQDIDGEVPVWVVDNGSGDGSQAMVLNEFKGVNLVWNSKNLGYSRACNQGVEQTGTPYVVVMNTDTVLREDTLKTIVEYFERHPEAGIVGPKILNSDGSLQFSCREFPSVKDAFMHAFLGYFVSGNRYSKKYLKMDWDHREDVEVDWVSGAFMGIRRKAFDDIEGFDEKYFMYVEDVDLCWRMWQSGWKVGYVPAGDVYHHIGMTSRMVSTSMSLHHHLSMLRFHRRTYRGPLKFIVDPAVAAGIMLRFLMVTCISYYYKLKGSSRKGLYDK
ncbi:MAG: glycosyltransferase family 2 protein [Actinobacteria bacterium]|nr:glycosyltransferase family 2 protein [Actinomycetota bacterium]